MYSLVEDIRFYLKTEQCEREEKIAPFLRVEADKNENRLERTGPRFSSLTTNVISLVYSCMHFELKGLFGQSAAGI